MQRIYFTGDGDTSKAHEATLELTADMSNDDCAEISHRGSEEKHRDRIGHSSRIAPGSHVFLRSRMSSDLLDIGLRENFDSSNEMNYLLSIFSSQMSIGRLIISGPQHV
ncbi:hypothetical protein ACOSQ3_004065 [Xanthoceras sorbifolium]